MYPSFYCSLIEPRRIYALPKHMHRIAQELRCMLQWSSRCGCPGFNKHPRAFQWFFILTLLPVMAQIRHSAPFDDPFLCVQNKQLIHFGHSHGCFVKWCIERKTEWSIVWTLTSIYGKRRPAAFFAGNHLHKYVVISKDELRALVLYNDDRNFDL